MTSDAQPVRGHGPAPIRSDERSGVLQPRNLNRYNAGRLPPAPYIAHVVDGFWHVNWLLEPGERIDQRIIDLPLITLTIEEGNVPGPFVATGVQSSAWVREIEGQGSVFAIRLRPAGLRALSDLSPARIADATVPITQLLDERLYSLLNTIAIESTPERRALVANTAIRERLDGHRLNANQRLANRIFEVLTDDVRARVGVDLATELNVGERSIQRALKETIGHGPKWVSRRIRLQEVARLLATDPDLDLGALALDLGYTDQAHLTNDFREVANVSPAAYRRSLNS